MYMTATANARVLHLPCHGTEQRGQRQPARPRNETPVYSDGQPLSRTIGYMASGSLSSSRTAAPSDGATSSPCLKPNTLWDGESAPPRISSLSSQRACEVSGVVIRTVVFDKLRSSPVKSAITTYAKALHHCVLRLPFVPTASFSLSAKVNIPAAYYYHEGDEKDNHCSTHVLDR